MNIFLLLLLIFVVPLILFLGYLIFSSCMGDRLCVSLAESLKDVLPKAGSNDKPPASAYHYGPTYLRNLSSSAGGWEQIAMEDMFDRAREDP